MVPATIAFISVLVISSLCNRYPKNKKMLINICGFILIVFAGIRSISFGGDLLTYYNKYLLFGDQSYLAIWDEYSSGAIKDGGFYLFVRFLSGIGFSYQQFLFIVAILFMIPIIRMIYYSEIPVLSFSMLLTLTWFQFSLTGLRQSLAMALCFTALLMQIKNKKSIVAIVLIMLSGLFHSSSLVFLAAYLFIRLDIKIKVKLFWIICIGAIFASVFGSTVFRQLVVSFSWSDSLQRYSDSAVSLNWTGFLIQLIVSGLCFMNYSDILKSKPWMAPLFTIMTVGVVAQAFSSVIAEMFRISMYFSIVSIILLPASLASMRTGTLKKLLRLAVIAGLIAYFFISPRYTNYDFFWRTLM